MMIWLIQNMVNEIKRKENIKKDLLNYLKVFVPHLVQWTKININIIMKMNILIIIKDKKEKENLFELLKIDLIIHFLKNDLFIKI